VARGKGEAAADDLSPQATRQSNRSKDRIVPLVRWMTVLAVGFITVSPGFSASVFAHRERYPDFAWSPAPLHWSQSEGVQARRVRLICVAVALAASPRYLCKGS